MIQMAPSILDADFGNMASELKKIAHADMVHIDVMDGRFVPNITLGLPMVKAIAENTDLILDVHLMIEQPEKYIAAFAKAGADRITIHVEADHIGGLNRALDIMDEVEVDKGMAIRPMTKLSAILPYVKQLNQLTIMTVEPGFGGQGFMNEQLEVIEQAKGLLRQVNRDCEIQVDGGINLKNVEKVVAAGADIIVAGSAIFGTGEPKKSLEAFRKLLG